MATPGDKINGKGLNGYKVRSWGDLIAVATLLSMLLACVGWGLKLEQELNDVRSDYGHRLANLEARVGDGILPRAEERTNSLRRDLTYLAEEFRQHETNHDK